MYVRKILGNIGDRVLADVHPAAKDLIAGINKLSGTVALPPNATGNTTLAAFDQLVTDDQVKIENIVEDYFISIYGMLPTTPVIGTPSGNTKDYRAGIALMMSIAIVVMAIDYMALVTYVGYVNRVIPDWTDVFMPFVSLTAVVWNYNGLLTKENRDAIAASLGSIPGGFLSNITAAIFSRRKPPVP